MKKILLKLMVVLAAFSTVSQTSHGLGIFLVNVGMNGMVSDNPLGVVLGVGAMVTSVPVLMIGGGLLPFMPILGMGFLLDNSNESAKLLAEKIQSYGARPDEAMNLSIVFNNAILLEQKNGSEVLLNIKELQHVAPEFTKTEGFSRMLSDLQSASHP